jgi:nucleotide-binding universal stress UspA family protein
MPVSLLLPIDDSPFSVAAVDEVARSLRPDKMDIHVLHVLELDRMVPVALDFARGAGYGADVQAHLQTARLEAERLVGDAATRLRREGFTVTTSVQEGDPRHVIIDCASEHNCDCIILGSHGRRGVDRFLLGSVPDAVSRHAHCSVYVVRPRAW